MGKKIPAKKHHGVKDPVKQNEQRNAKIRLKINEAPENIDSQEIPKKIRNLFKKQKRKSSPNVLPTTDKKGKAIVNEFQPQRPLKTIPKMDRRPGESDKDLLWRAELTTRNYMVKAKFEDKYDVDLDIDEKTGQFKTKKRKLPYLDDLQKVEPETKWERKKLKKAEEKRKEREEKQKIRKEKFKLRKMKKKGRKIVEDDFGGLKQDKVEFGEVAEQPPTLTAKPRKSTIMDKPGKRDLLLKGLIPNDRPSNLSGKRKDLSALDRQTLEDERQRAVDLYREMQKLKQNNRA